MPTLGEIADVIGAAVPNGRRDLPIDGIGSLHNATARQVIFLADEKYQRQLATTNAAAVVITARLAATAQPLVRPQTVLLLVDDAGAAMQRALEHLAPPVPRPAPGVHASAVVASTARIGNEVAIGPHVVIGENAAVGDDTVLHAGVVLGADASVGQHCELFAHVVLRERCTIGHRVIIHAGSVIGTDGFGYRWDGKSHAKLPHIGTVVIEDDVEIGSCSCVDRAKVDETRIGSGTRIDNLVQVGHNVRIGRHCIVCAGTSIGGSSVLEDGVIVAGAVGIADHTTLRAGARAGGMAGVRGEIEAGATIVGVPAVPYNEFLREQAALRKLPELLKTIRALAARLAALESQRDTKSD